MTADTYTPCHCGDHTAIARRLPGERLALECSHCHRVEIVLHPQFMRRDDESGGWLLCAVICCAAIGLLALVLAMLYQTGAIR